MEISKERINEMGYALCLVLLSRNEVRFNPEQFKRQLGNLSQELQHLPRQFGGFTREELQEGLKVISHDLVDYAFGFTWGKKKKRKKETIH
jgi:hypothetical protein